MHHRHHTSILHEKATLLAFKNALSPQYQDILPNWNETTDVCNFVGVGCNKWGLHVSHLSLAHMLISGSIPPMLSNLTGLHILDLSWNAFTGEIPSEFSNLPNLLALDLSNNNLTGVVPGSFSKLSSLQFLNLGNNCLAGEIPASIFLNCTKLWYVYLHGNSLSGEIPSAREIYLPDLLGFDLYSNHLTGRLPSWLSNSTKLTELDIEDNSLFGELPIDIIRNKTQLEVLHLSGNDFWSHDGNTNLEPFFDALSNCSMLKEIEMASIGIGGKLPTSIWSAPRSLTHVSLENNMISGQIPQDIGYLYNLTFLNLSSNRLDGPIPASIGHLASLEELFLSNNSLTGTIPLQITNLSHLGLLDLSSNLLYGAIPAGIGNLSQLRYIFFQRNQFSGNIPVSLESCLSLNQLDLSYNQLSGRIPEEIAGIVKWYFNLSNNRLQGPLPIAMSKMDQVEEIDLSNNKLTGKIFSQLSGCVRIKRLNLSHNLLYGTLPDSLGELLSLETLDLSYNQLSGKIPQSLNNCRSLTYLNLSFNNFSGFVPTDGIFSSFTYLSYIRNPYLCGLIIGQPCNHKHQSWLRSRKFLIVASVVASLLAFLLTIIVVIGIRKCKEKISTIREGKFLSSSTPVVKSKYPRITYRELVEVTDEFSQDRLVGSGSYGRVYRGALQDGTLVAIKVLQLQTGNSTKSFNRECEVLKRIRHRNLMRIITACSLPDFKALVLPFMANGSLERCLYSGSVDLGLLERVNICSDIAEGMAYLHHHSPVKVIHCDLKPSNVLLNDDMTALVSDFGISRLVMSIVGGGTTVDNVGASTANMLCGSIGYIAPEYGYGSNASTKGDVYSFGVLVLEVITKRRPTDEMFEGGLSLHAWVKRYYHGRAESVVDSTLLRTIREQTQEVRRMSEVAICEFHFLNCELLELGILCTQESPSLRPTMLDAADDLDRLKSYLAGDSTATFASSLGLSSTTFGDD
ncbi:putative leucine-rich repeat receptor-like serine/threonine-protein kinase [Carex littledalei]|uniref:non-specific serine/threonine protein kinase n=1 Tax=Carex littledalei TaxID=544730 RepID=A0A833QZE4_9POAL|nr:putative leucine-rich repeat receptor-like serine/threonine-protein kinase [Carex littledalei]